MVLYNNRKNDFFHMVACWKDFGNGLCADLKDYNGVELVMPNFFEIPKKVFLKIAQLGFAMSANIMLQRHYKLDTSGRWWGVDASNNLYIFDAKSFYCGEYDINKYGLSVEKIDLSNIDESQVSYYQFNKVETEYNQQFGLSIDELYYLDIDCESYDKSDIVRLVSCYNNTLFPKIKDCHVLETSPIYVYNMLRDYISNQKEINFNNKTTSFNEWKKDAIAINNQLPQNVVWDEHTNFQKLCVDGSQEWFK